MTGIVLVAFALLLAIFSLVLWLFPELLPEHLRARLGWGLWLIASVILITIALEWGNIGVIYSHAGWTGYR
ncbi:MAG TPA: hypothetical protein VH084_28415 [Mycobacterium sp.]|jgi:hypothetical protein|nr:hypothetical protein [Mycobacterium sp.]